MPKLNSPYLVLLFLLVSAGTSAQTDDRTAILALMQQAFLAVGSDDPEDMRALQLADGTSISMRPHSNGKKGKFEMRLSTNEAFLDGPIEQRRLVEAWTAEPTLIIGSPIAVVWGEYDFWIDGEFSHCGIDSVSLVKLDGEWKIANWIWTVETKKCPTKPK
jgi:hypothetical protein